MVGKLEPIFIAPYQGHNSLAVRIKERWAAEVIEVHFKEVTARLEEGAFNRVTISHAGESGI